MECGRASREARDEDEGGQMVAFELEAAEALAGLARSSSLRGAAFASGELRPTEALVVASATHSQVFNRPTYDQPVAAEQVCHAAPSKITSPRKAEKIVENVPSQLGSTSCQSNPEVKFRRKLTEAEKEERKLRRILANRESARQTIRRRQAMYLELTRKAAEVVEENENLKKKKDLAVEEYNSLKGRNEFLKAQLAEVKKAEAGETEEEPKTSEAEKSSSATTTSTPIFLHNRPPVVPCFWPSVLPSSDVFPFQCASHSHNTSSSQFPMPLGDYPCPHQGQEHFIGNTRPGTPLFVVPLPWLLPLLAHSSTLHSRSSINDSTNAHQCSRCSCPNTRPHEDNNQLSSEQNMTTEASNPLKAISADSVHRPGLTLPPDSGGGQYDTRDRSGAVFVPGLFSPVKPVETLGPRRSCQVDDTADITAVTAPESMRHGSSQRNQESVIRPPKKPEDIFAATVARRKRKELMKLKNVHCHDLVTRY